MVKGVTVKGKPAPTKKLSAKKQARMKKVIEKVNLKRKNNGKDPLDIPPFLDAKKRPQGVAMTDLIEFKITSLKYTPRWTIRRFVNDGQSAREYFTSFANGRKCNFTNNGKLATWPDSADSIISNYSIPHILAMKGPKKNEKMPMIQTSPNMLAEMHDPGIKPSNSEGEYVPSPGSFTAKAEEKAKRTSGEYVPLKSLCQELKIDPRAARIKLRRAVTDVKKYPALVKSHAHHARWEWAVGSDALADVRKALS